MRKRTTQVGRINFDPARPLIVVARDSQGRTVQFASGLRGAKLWKGAVRRKPTATRLAISRMERRA